MRSERYRLGKNKNAKTKVLPQPKRSRSNLTAAFHVTSRLLVKNGCVNIQCLAEAGLTPTFCLVDAMLIRWCFSIRGDRYYGVARGAGGAERTRAR